MKRVLIVVDFQYDFVKGALGFKGAEKIDKNIVKLIQDFENNDDEIIFTMDTHFTEDYFETIEGKNLPILHCIKDTEGWQIYGETAKYAKNHKVIMKNSFGSLELGNYIHSFKDEISEIIICGLITDICVFENTIILKNSCNPTTRVYLKEDAISTSNNDIKNKCFDLLKHLYVDII